MIALAACVLSPLLAPQEFEYVLRPPDRDQWSCAGGAMAVDGDWLFVGASGGNSCASTASYLPALFKRDGTGRHWDYVRALRPPGSNLYGTSNQGVDIDSGHMVAGIGGRLRAFEFDAVLDDWVEIAEITDPGASGGPFYTDRVDVDGDRMLVIQNLLGSRLAHVFAFDHGLGEWVFDQSIGLSPQDLTPWGWLDGDTIGLVMNDSPISSISTVIEVREFTGSSWPITQTIDAASVGSTNNVFFGVSSGIQDDLLAIGDEYDLRVLERAGPGTPFVLTETLAADVYGSIVIEEGAIICGAWPSSAVDVWRRPVCRQGAWTRTHRLRTVDKHTNGPTGSVSFGYGLAADGEIIAAGAPEVNVINGPSHGRTSGAASVFRAAVDLDGNGVEDVCQIQSFEDDVDGDGLLDIIESPGSRYCSPNVPTSLGYPATILLQGSEFVAENRLVVTMLGVPTGSYGLMIAGRLPGFFPAAGINDGNLCIAGGVARRPGRTHSYWFAGFDNVIHQEFDTSYSPWGQQYPLLPGETWFFQGWFRDNGASNMTDAMRIFFQ